jgi:hypothetical protein
MVKELAKQETRIQQVTRKAFVPGDGFYTYQRNICWLSTDYYCDTQQKTNSVALSPQANYTD